ASLQPLTLVVSGPTVARDSVAVGNRRTAAESRATYRVRIETRPDPRSSCMESLLMISTPRWKRGLPLLAVGGLCLVLSAAFLLLGPSLPVPAADHRDGPNFPNTPLAGQSDINDIYAFVSPSNANNTVL